MCLTNRQPSIRQIFIYFGTLPRTISPIVTNPSFQPQRKVPAARMTARKHGVIRCAFQVQDNLPRKPGSPMACMDRMPPAKPPSSPQRHAIQHGASVSKQTMLATTIQSVPASEIYQCPFWRLAIYRFQDVFTRFN